MAASTGSPASRRFTQLMPLTTRPSLTSRQGMTRTLNISPCPRCFDHLQRRRRIEASIVQGATDDGAGEFAGAGRNERAYVFDRGEPAGSDQRNSHDVG